MNIKTMCPQCGVVADMDDAHEFQFCRYCGAKVNVKAAAQNIQGGQAVGADSGKPNLIIRYNATNPGVTMIVRFLFNNQVQYFYSGQSFSFYMPYGTHRVTLQIGRRNYARDIYLPENNAAVTIYASWNGRAHIEISNPPYTPPVQQVVYVPVQAPVNMPAGAPTSEEPVDGRLCPNCGRMNEKQFLFCKYCGTKMEEAVKEESQDAEDQNLTVCENCGRTLRDDDVFCPGCGTKNPHIDD